MQSIDWKVKLEKPLTAQCGRQRHCAEYSVACRRYALYRVPSKAHVTRAGFRCWNPARVTWA